MPVKNRLGEMQDEIAAWRQDIHAHPELLYDTHRTAALVADRLRGFGCDSVTEGIGRTGVVGVIRGRTDSRGAVVGMRADMDALPIAEATGAAHASTVPGVMHACGHDGHTAMLLGAAQYLAETRNFDGTVVVIFQPAEEGGCGGKAMVDDGLMERWNIQEVYALHTAPGLPVGQFATRPGPILASVDEFSVQITGHGGHAARPQVTVDPTVVAAQMVLAIQTIVSRSTDPVEAAVVSVTSCTTSSTAYNVIPQSAELRGTVRTYSGAVRDVIEARLRTILAGVAATFGADVALDYRFGAPATVNAADQAGYAAEAAAAVSGACGEAEAMMGAEDFSFMLEARPGAFVRIGNGDGASLHHPEFDFKDAAIPYGCSFFAELAERRMPVA